MTFDLGSALGSNDEGDSDMVEIMNNWIPIAAIEQYAGAIGIVGRKGKMENIRTTMCISKLIWLAIQC